MDLLLRLQLGYKVDLFDSTHYLSKENSSPQNRVKFLQARNFDEKEDLRVNIKTDLLGDFRKKTTDYKPDFIIFSIVEDAFLQSLELLRKIQDLEIPHLIGGIFPTAAPEFCMQFSLIRALGIGEGERTVVEAAEAVRQGRFFDGVRGVWYKDNRGVVRKNSPGPLVNIDLIHPDFSLFDEARFYRPMGGKIFKTIPVETYRGCPFNCTYCNSPMQKNFSKNHGLGNFLRRKSLSSLRTELSELINKFKPEFFYFVDDSFLARPSKEICDFYGMYEEFSLPFWFNTRPENCTKENLKKMKESGCYRISFGIECGNEQYRVKILKRNVSNEQLIEKFKIIEESKIAFSVNLIIGFPGETRELIMDTVELVRSINGFDTLTVSMFTPYHGTVLRGVAVKNGWLEEKAITKHTTSQSMLDMPKPYVSKEDLDGLMRVIPLYCYFPKSEWEAIRRVERDGEEGKQILNRYAAIYKEKFLKQAQDEAKECIVEGQGGCRTNPKDAFRMSPARLTTEEIEMLTPKEV